MSSLLDKIRADHRAALVEGNRVARNLLATVIAACDNLAKAGKVARDLTEADVIGVVKSTVSKLGETIGIIKDKPERAEELAKATTEMDHLATYLPKQLSAEELTEIAVRQHSLGSGLPQIMAHFKANYPGQYDAALAANIVRGVVIPG